MAGGDRPPPPGLAEAVARVLGEVAAYRRVGGGCIANALRVETRAGTDAFLKWSRRDDPAAATFGAEREGLDALAATGAVRVPRVLARLDAADASGLLLEWLEPAAPTPAAWAELGRDLARLHAGAPPQQAPGWPTDNYIGPLPQANGAAGGWADFWWERRLAPQGELAAGALGGLRRRVRALRGRLDHVLAGAEAEGLSLLHGDLWSGNVHFAAGSRREAASGPPVGSERVATGRRAAVQGDGAPGGAVRGALVDPSAYVGHREVDLAMAALFGGFPPEFVDAYTEVAPLAQGWRDRRAAYQLYYLLVHVNLFGAGYLPGLARALDALGV